MSAVDHPSDTGRAPSTVAPILPLALLEAIRAHDRPREVLEDEDLAASLPRRLGLTGVVESQIRRFEEADRKGRGVPLDEVRDLFRLVLRRPDAESILRDGGARLARRHARRLATAAVGALGIVPAAAAAATRRSVRSLLRRVAGGTRVEISGWPLRVRIRDGLAADVDATGTACVLYAAALEELLELYTRSRPNVEHRDCQARGGECCEWTWAQG